MQSQVRGDLLGPKSQLCWKEGLGQPGGETRQAQGGRGSVRTPLLAHPQPEAGEWVGGGVQGRLHSACILGVGWTPSWASVAPSVKRSHWVHRDSMGRCPSLGSSLSWVPRVPCLMPECPLGGTWGSWGGCSPGSSEVFQFRRLSAAPPGPHSLDAAAWRKVALSQF